MPDTSEPPPSIAPVGQGDYLVKPGDGMTSIADGTGHFWETIWNDPANAALKEARHPEVLMPGDRVTIPPITPKRVLCGVGKLHTFRRRGVPVTVALVIKDAKGNVFAEKRYELTVGGKSYVGTTDGQGGFVAWVTPAAREGQLIVWLDTPGYPERAEWTVGIGHVDPLAAISGVQARLRNLGFDCGDEHGEAGPLTRDALIAFQTRNELEATGEPDDATREKLRELVGY